MSGKNAKSPNSSNRNAISALLSGVPNFAKLKISNKFAICLSLKDSIYGIVKNMIIGIKINAIIFQIACLSREVLLGDIRDSCLLWEDKVVTSIRQVGSLKPQVKVRELRVGQAEMLPWGERWSWRTGPLYIRGNRRSESLVSHCTSSSAARGLAFRTKNRA